MELYGNIMLGWIYLLTFHELIALANAKCSFTHSEINIPKTSFQKQDQFFTDTLTFTVSWRQTLLRMRLESHVISPDGAVMEWYEGDNLTEIETLQDDAVFYQGYIIGSNYSYVALEYTNGFSGYIQLDDEGIFIEPMLNGEGTANGSHIMQSCGKTAPPFQINHTSTRRSRRAAPNEFTKYIEVMVVADTSVVEFVGKDKVKAYIMGLMNIVNTVYHDDSLGLSIEVVTVKIMFMNKAGERKVIQMNEPQRTVGLFCRWVSSQSYRSYRSAQGSNHDVAVLLTRSKFASAGHAPITGLCVPGRSCAIVKDGGFTSAFVIAHEMAHVFGLMHDGHGNECHGRAYATSIMATVLQSSFTHYWWSACSRKQMRAVIDSLYCLNNNPHIVIKDDLKMPLGLSYSLDEQCRFEFGSKAKFCRAFRMADPCSQLWCDDGQRRYHCKTKNGVPLEGTQCGPTPRWYCKTATCGYHGPKAPIHGGWSDWSGWSNCSATCDIGFKRRSRICDHPKPEYGGNSCDGVSDNTDACIAEVCTNYVDQRAYQCGMMGEVILWYDGKDERWLPYQTDKEDDICKLTCVTKKTQAVVTFDVLVDNGTPCSYDEPNMICMDGTCEKVGCDGVRGSDKSPDKCGICNGDGTSCKTVSGVYERKFAYSAAGLTDEYKTVLVLPKGARGITIAETSTLPHFLALLDTVYYSYILNGDGIEGNSKKFVLEGAWFHYTNTLGHETLETKGPIRRDIILRIYPQSYIQPASLNYSYVVDNNDFTLEKTKYKWKYEDWSPCSVSCGKGVQHIFYGCYNRDSDMKMDDKMCQYIDNKDTDVECTMVHCQALLYNWRMIKAFSECSASCGDTGVYHRLYECERLSDTVPVDNSFCVHVPEPIDQQPCNQVPCDEIKYSWITSTHWSQCSATCGDSGTQIQLAQCVKEINKRDTVDMDVKFCSNLPDPRETRACNHLPCISYKWESTDSWQNCNETCGSSGVQNRKLVCRKYIGDEKMSDVGLWYCADKEQPDEARDCNRRACFSFKWVLTDKWTDCSTTCGSGGIRSKISVCKKVTYDDREISVPEDICDKNEKEIESESCQLPPCVGQIYWSETTDWSQCSVSCGNGIQLMEQQCIQPEDGVERVVDQVKCEEANIPRTTRNCNAGPCGFLEWGAGPWLMCSNTFGEGKQKRQTYCGEASKGIPLSRCPGKAPGEYQPCNDGPCDNADKKPPCTGDRAPFCGRASPRFCSHPAYSRVCCKSCSNIKDDKKGVAKRHRRHRRH